MTKLSQKIEAIHLRKKGFSYNQIKESIGVSKSTLSDWLNDVPYTPNKTTKDRIARSHTALSDSRRKIKMDSITRAQQMAKQDIGLLSRRDLFMLGLGIYMGEGSKTVCIRLVNSDSSVIKTGILWFKKIYNLPNSSFAIRIHLYPDCNIRKSMEHWSSQTGLPLSQFHPVYVDLRQDKKAKNKSKLPFGTAHVTIRSGGNPELGVLLMRRILLSIEIAKKEAGLV